MDIEVSYARAMPSFRCLDMVTDDGKKIESYTHEDLISDA